MKLNESLITFITAGYPNRERNLDLLLTMSEFSDMIELGIPFSDPIADGKIIQRANVKALSSGFRVADIFGIAKKLRRHTSIPLMIMTYYNPIFSFGLREFLENATASEIDGMIVVDLPPEEAGEYIETSRSLGLKTIFLCAPNTSKDRLRMIDEIAEFIYLVSTYGVTGTRENISNLAFDALKRIKAICKKKVAVGFGISNGKHVRELIRRGADGVVVGSALIKTIEEGRSLREKLKDLRSGLDACER
jgi:tryptophan synthase alpha chain